MRRSRSFSVTCTVPVEQPGCRSGPQFANDHRLPTPPDPQRTRNAADLSQAKRDENLPGPAGRSAQRRVPALHRSAPVVQPLRLLHELLHGLDGVLELGEAAGVHEDAYAFAVELHPQRQERHAVGREFRQPYLVAAKAGQDRAALALLTIEILHGARGALGTTGHGWCDPSFAVTPRGPSRNPRAKTRHQGLPLSPALTSDAGVS